MNYIFTCKFCSNSGLETYRRTSATIPQMCITTIANLQRKTDKDGNLRYFFSIKEIIQFMEMYWESITTLARKTTNTWHSTILKTLQTHQAQFLTQEFSGDFHYGLVDSELTNIKPQYDEKATAQKEEGEYFNKFVGVTVCLHVKLYMYTYLCNIVFFLFYTYTKKNHTIEIKILVFI